MPPINLLMFFLHDQHHAGPPVLNLSCEQIDSESKSALIWAPLSIEDALHVFHPLVCQVRTCLPIKLSWLMFQEILQAPFMGWRLGVRIVHRSTNHVFLQLTEGLHMLPLSSLRRQPRNLHLLHHHLLLLKRGMLALYRRLMLLHHGIALLCQGCSHNLNRSCEVLPIALTGWRRSHMRGCHITGHTEGTIS